MKQIFIIIVQTICTLFFSYSPTHCDFLSAPINATFSFIAPNLSNENTDVQKTVRHAHQLHNEFSTIDYNFFSLINMSSTQLKNYFDRNSYQQSDILQCIPLYQSNEFTGFYKARLLVNGRAAKYEASFFPAHWTREQVIDTIFEAYDNFIKNGVRIFDLKKGKYMIEKQISTNISIKIVLNQTGKIITAYPVIK